MKDEDRQDGETPIRAAEMSVPDDDAVRENEDDEGVEPDVRDMAREQLESELEVARAEIERLHDQSLRRQAELINYRRRVQKEQAELSTVAQARLLEGLVPVIDDFERAVGAEAEDARAYHEGMQLILRRVQKVLEQIGVERLEPRGEAFDPRFHEAIARHEAADVPEGQILDVYQPGYRLKDRLIRPATVVVAYGGEPSGEGTAAEVSAVPGDGDDNGGRDDG